MMQPHRRSRDRAAVLLTGLLTAASAGAELTPREARGKIIYLEGTSPSGGEITALMGDAATEVPASVLPCSGCHGRDGRGRPEGGVIPSNLTWPALTKPYGIDHAGGRQHPPYDDRSLKRAITLGSDPAGNRLHLAMPRYQLSHQDLDDLVRYIRRLGDELDPGLTDDAITLATLVPRQGRAASLGTAIEAMLTAYFDHLNPQGGVYGRRLELRVLAAPHDPAQRAAVVREATESGEIFAFLGAYLPGAEAEITAVLEEHQVPLVGPFTQQPQVGFPLNPFVFYLLPGLEDLGRALVGYADGDRGEEPSSATVLSDTEPHFEATARAIVDLADELDWPTTRARVSADLDLAAIVDRISREETEQVFLLASGEQQAEFFQRAATHGWYPRVFLPGSLLTPATFEAPVGFAERIFLAFPMLPSNQATVGTEEYRTLASRYALPSRHLTAQIATLASGHVLFEALRRAGHDVSRHRLVEVLEGFSEVDNGFTPTVTYGPNRRVGIRGAYVVALDLEGRTLRPSGRWVESR